MDEPRYTHAGGLVVRRRGSTGELEALLVRPSDGSDAWVLPKGHIEPGEQPEQTAVREVREEAGVEAGVDDFVGSASFVAKGERVSAAYYLMRWERDVPRAEERAVAWVPLEEVRQRLTHEDARSVAGRALKMLRESAHRTSEPIPRSDEPAS